MSRVVISVIGAGNNAPREAVEMAEAVGRELAKRGAVVVCGGLNGVMEAVCRGAKSEGGVTIGVLPGDDPESANSFVDFPVPTGMGHARNAIVVKAGLAVIARGREPTAPCPRLDTPLPRQNGDRPEDLANLPGREERTNNHSARRNSPGSCRACAASRCQTEQVGAL